MNETIRTECNADVRDAASAGAEEHQIASRRRVDVFAHARLTVDRPRQRHAVLPVDKRHKSAAVKA